jgi:CO/xanthine dehydrogenase Mo-binding subunit
VVNPRAARGQVTGAIVQGIGLALTDRFDHTAVSPSIMTHGAPRATDAPAIEVVFEGGDGDGAVPAGIGELAIVAVPAAIANAFARAGGVSCDRLPLRPEVVVATLEGAAP